MKMNIGDLVVMKEQSVKTTRTICSIKERLREEMGNFLVKKSDGKSRYSAIHEPGDSL